MIFDDCWLQLGICHIAFQAFVNLGRAVAEIQKLLVVDEATEAQYGMQAALAHQAMRGGRGRGGGRGGGGRGQNSRGGFGRGNRGGTGGRGMGGGRGQGRGKLDYVA